MNESESPKIVVSKDGPYLVTGSVPISVQVIGTEPGGGSWEWEQGRTYAVRESCALCRCGQSGHAPYCDGTHLAVGFDGTETADRTPFQQQKTVLEGPTMEMDDARSFCAVARFCDTLRDAWDLVEATADPDARELLIHHAMRCPSGRLVARDKQTREEFEPEFEPSIGVVEDPAEACSGPLWIRGGIALESEDGEPYESRNRMTLCRCGGSKNKPFCDGTHSEVKYRDLID